MNSYKYISWFYVIALFLLLGIGYYDLSGNILLIFYIPFLILIFSTVYFVNAKRCKIDGIKSLLKIEYCIKIFLHFLVSIALVNTITGIYGIIFYSTILIIIIIDLLIVGKIHEIYKLHMTNGGDDVLSFKYINKITSRGLEKEMFRNNRFIIKLVAIKLLPLLLLANIPVDREGILILSIIFCMYLVALILSLRSVNATIKILELTGKSGLKYKMIYVILDIIPIISITIINEMDFYIGIYAKFAILLPYFPVTRLMDSLKIEII